MDRDRDHSNNQMHPDGRPAVYDVYCPNCGTLNAQISNGGFLHLRCKKSGCKVYFSGRMVAGRFICIEGKGRRQPIMQAGPPTFIG